MLGFTMKVNHTVVRQLDNICYLFFFFPPTKPLCWMDLKCCDKKTTKQGLLNIKCKTIKWSLLWERLLLLLPLGGHIQLLLQYVWYFMSLDSPCCWGMSRILLSVLSFSSNFFRFGYADPPPSVEVITVTFISSSNNIGVIIPWYLTHT